MRHNFSLKTHLKQTQFDLENIKQSNQQVLENVYNKNVPNAANKKSFSELLGTENRYKKKSKKSENEEKKEYLSELLLDFNQKEQNPRFDELLTELYKLKKYCKQNKIPMNFNSCQNNSKYLLLYILEKILFEISYVRSKENRTQMINKVYNWYNYFKKADEDTRHMLLKTYKSPGEFDEEELMLLNNDEKNEEIDERYLDTSNHRNAELVNKRMLKEYERKKISDKFIKLPVIDNSKFSNSKNSIISNSSCPSFQKIDLSTIYSSEKGTNYYTLKKNYLNAVSNYIDKVEGGEKEKSYLKYNLNENDEFISKLNKETKYSYSFFRPEYKFDNLVLENKIMENKQKLLEQKRYEEEMKIKMKEFGIYRAKYIENINNRYEMKTMLNMYVNNNKFKSQILKKYENKKSKSQDIENEEEKNDQNINNNFTILSKQSSSNKLLFSTPKIKNIFSSKQLKVVPFDLNNNNNKINNINNDNNDDSSCDTPRDKKILQKKMSFSVSPDIIFLKMKNNKEEKENNENKENKNNSSPIIGDVFTRTPIRKRSRSLRKRKTESFHHHNSKFKIIHDFNINENKVKINEIKNIDKKSKNIKGLKDCKTIDNDIKLKLPENINEINMSRNIKKIQPDTVSFLYFNNSLFKEKMCFDAICNIKNNNKKKKDSFSSSNESNNLNFQLSAFSPENLCKINRNNILNNIIDKKLENNDNKKIFSFKKNFKNLNKNFDEYKNNYLKLRRVLSSYKKKEYDSLINKLRNNKQIKEDDFEFDDENEDLYIKPSSSVNDINIKQNKNNSLIQAMVNPNDNVNCSKYFLPRNGSMLLSRKIDL